MTVSPRDSEFHKAVRVELLEARRKSPTPDLDLCALVEEVGDLARALRHYREDKIAWPQVVAEAVQVAVMAQRVAVEGDPSRRDATADPDGAPFSEVSAEPLPWIISFWAIFRSDVAEGYYAAQRMEIGSDGVQPTPEIQVAASLDEARRLIPPGLHRFSRHPLDDPSVVEVWI